MSHHNFGKIQTVPPLGDFLDIVLSKTQRKTPTVIHKGYAIIRIRNFYMRKVKFTRDTFDEKLGAILQDFPRIEDIHPFYGDLLNVLYDKDHYKLALGQINTARHMIDNVARDYVKLLKYGDSLYRCKQLKRAALGRMATIMKRQKDTLLYLEQVRQHLSRLPSIDPNTRTLLLCGYPNVGKSSFMNKLTRANVEVQPYAFTTKSLFVGHMDYKYLRWQVIDTPGILDHPLEERNTIEMQSITAMAHIRACVLFFLDLSESCGYTIKQQVSLFESLRPLFSNKPLLLICNKIDLMRPDQLSGEDFAILQGLLDQGIEMAESSCVTEEGVMNVRNSACEKLLNQRVEAKMRSQKISDVLNKLHLAEPTSRDERTRPAFIPEAVLKKRVENNNVETERKLARDVELENGGAGVYNINLKDKYMLANPEWKYDIIPEIMDGKNIADFIDPEIEEKLRRLEEEEEQFEAAGAYDFAHEKPQSEQEKAFKTTLKKIRQVKKLRHMEHTSKTNLNSRPVLVDRIKKNLKRVNVSADNENVDIDVDSSIGFSKRIRTEKSLNRSQVRGTSRGTSVQIRDRSTLGLRDSTDLAKSTNIHRLDQRIKNMDSRRGEADRRIQESKPKHLFSGKRTSGTNDRR
jgi:nucleolar GTP-binding protein